MVEGPGVHRVAIAHRRVLVGKPFSATSPSGRFAEGASAISGRYLSLIEAHGKNIFYFFTRQKLEEATLAKLPDDVKVVHIHFGMSGSFRTFDSPGPEPREKTRLKLENKKEKIVAHLSAQLCLHGNIELYKKRITELGPDPLRDDADKETVWRKMQKSKKTIGGIIMDQSFIAGIGNIYRTEILFVIGVHPDQRVSTLTRSTFEELWSHSVRLLKVGVVTGSISTVSPEEAGKPYSKLKSGERRYVYSHETCMRCGGPVRSWPSAARTVYACEVCQPLREVNDNGVDKTVGEDALDGEIKAPRSRARVASTKADSEGTRTEKQKKSSVKKTKESATTIKFRKRKIMDGRIVEHQALKDIPAGGLVDFPGNIDDLTWPSVSSKTSKNSSSLSNSRLVPPQETGMVKLSCVPNHSRQRIIKRSRKGYHWKLCSWDSIRSEKVFRASNAIESVKECNKKDIPDETANFASAMQVDLGTYSPLDLYHYQTGSLENLTKKMTDCLNHIYMREIGDATQFQSRLLHRVSTYSLDPSDFSQWKRLWGYRNLFSNDATQS